MDSAGSRDRTDDPSTAGAGNAAERAEPVGQPGAEGAPDGASAVGEVAELTAALAVARAEAEERLDAWKRARADYENLKRRSVTEVEERAAHARGALLLEFLPIVDNFERAFRADRVEDADAWAEGISLIEKEIGQFLERLGVRPIAAQGHVFDPNVHEAVGQAPGPDNEVLAEVRKGYVLGVRVLRPAMVIVGQGGDASTTNSESTSE